MSDNGSKGTALVAGGAARGIIPQTFEDAYRLARVFAATKLVPKDFQDKPEDCCVAILQGLELGMSPIAAVQSIAVINGRPCLWGDGMLAVVRASGLLETIKEEDNGSTATCTVKRKGDLDPVVRKFSQDDAKRAGLAGTPGPWTQYPQRMRQMRARSWALRDVFTDVLKGISSAEEMQDVTPVMRDITPAREPLPDIPDIPDGTEANTCDAEADQRHSDQDYLKSLDECLAAASSVATLQEVMEANTEEISDRGLQQEAANLYEGHRSRMVAAMARPMETAWKDVGIARSVDIEVEPATETVAETGKPSETIDIPWDDEPETETATLSDEAAEVALKNFAAALAKCPNGTRIKDLRRAWSGNIDAFSPTTRARFDALVAQALVRVKQAAQAYAAG